MGSSADLAVEKPGVDKQLALGVSARAEFVMPYFNIGVGLGTNFLHKGGDLKAFYQMLTLKVAVTRSSYVHIGYSLRDFHMPNFLMLGVGYRFNNKEPRNIPGLFQDRTACVTPRRGRRKAWRCGGISPWRRLRRSARRQA